MINDIYDIVTVVLLTAGCFFILSGAIGVVRMPDVFTRMHAAGMVDTLGASLVLIGLMFQSGWSLITLKLLVLLALLIFTGPVASHALARAAMYGGVRPQLSDKSLHLAVPEPGLRRNPE